MIRRFEVADAITPTGSTAVSEWMRLADVRADGCTIHEVRNLLACLIGIRFQAVDGWTAELRIQDEHCERALHDIISRRVWRRSVGGCAVEQPRLAACC